MHATRRLLLSLFFLIGTAATVAPAPASQMVNVTVTSTLLSAFWNRPVSIRADVLLPDSYDIDGGHPYPAIYWFTGFGSEAHDEARISSKDWSRAMARQKAEAIVVFPEAMFDGVYTEFADSANMGPWGTAFTQEFIPALNARYRITKSYVAGISSGGWAAMWLETTYPRLFSGGWGYAPDPLSFRDFLGPDLTKVPLQNFYANGKTEYGTMRVEGIDRQTLREFVVGGMRAFNFGPAQFDSFDAVFSPRGGDGPQRLFNWKTGDINASVAEYWEANYDIANRIVHDSPDERGQLTKRVHVIVGTWDTFHLDGPAKLFCYALYNLDLQPDCTLVNDADHFGVLHFDGNYENHILKGIFSSAASE